MHFPRGWESRMGACMSIRNRLRTGASPLAVSFAAALLTISTGALALDEGASKPPTPTSNEELLKKLDLMEKRIQMLEGQLKRKEAAASAPGGSQPASASPASPDPAAAGAAAPAGTEKPAGTKTPATKVVVKAAPGAAAAATTPDVAASKPILGILDSPVA